MHIAILDDYQNVALSMADWSAVAAKAEIAVFNEHLGGTDAVAGALAGFDAAVVMRERTPFPRALIEKLPDLKLLVTPGMRNLGIDLDAAADHGVMVCGTENVGSTTSELAWSLILALARNVVGEDANVRAGKWQSSVGIGLSDKTLGILGLGKIGASVAAVGRAFGMEVVAWSRNLTEARCAEHGVRLAASRDALLSEADFVTIHMVLSERTRALVGAREFALMKPTAYLVNTSRGPIVEEVALIEAVTSRRIAGAAIDVFDTEPLPPDHPMRRLPNAILTPHLGYVTDRNYRLWYRQCAEDVAAWLDGAPVRVLNAPA